MKGWIPNRSRSSNLHARIPYLAFKIVKHSIGNVFHSQTFSYVILQAKDLAKRLHDEKNRASGASALAAEKLESCVSAHDRERAELKRALSAAAEGKKAECS